MAAHRIILEKSWENHLGKVYPIGTILQVDNNLANDLLSSEIGKIYDGKYPPREKTKTEFFKPK